MKTLAALVLTLGLVFVPLQGALAQEGGDDKGGEGGGEGSGEGSGGTDSGAAADPWKAPKAAEDKPADKPADAPADNSIVVPPDAYPKAEIDRPLALLPLVLEPRFWFIFDGHLGEPDGGNEDNWVALKLGAGFGIIDNLEAGISFPLGLSPSVRGGDFQIYGIYELSDLLGVDGMRLGVDLDMNIRTSKSYNYLWGRKFGMNIGTPFKYKFHEMVGMTAKLNLGFAVNDPSFFLLGLEVGGMIQPIDWVVIELLFGLDGWIGDHSALYLPLTLRSAFTPIPELDIFVELGFPDLNYDKDGHYQGFWMQIMGGVAYRFGF
ncbi:MAG TPA: hypothetical protein PK668_00325 [Myxococcota bacterium]|nr:hypothetical protein [Myxococcota bacterium]HRY95722.1 hypothetical protein [Myxococcota bacterium]HSA21027.1 hypothetical protein [Myxococcota bacterium]